MARVRTIDPADFDPELAVLVGRPRSDRRRQVGSLVAWAVRPDLAAAMIRFQDALHTDSSLPPRLRELVRLRVAFHNRCRSCMSVRSSAAIADGMTDGAVCSLERPEDADDLSDAEKAALRYADLMATDHLVVDDSTFDELRKHFDDGQVLELGAHIGLCVGFGRLAATWDLIDDLPSEFLGADAAPWASGYAER